ncbi:hypothetical protein SCHPADRAFT_930129 [Schizopora paradoxa]|uniref:Uncharacterized protein n=1 Tax=Schizopora paradoxa TaxID=27342 RepID=A0A0H2S292_9AGAM|nr:hypothetical protein SCHPADRAFT_930129 [Schizopora paradoxa]
MATEHRPRPRRHPEMALLLASSTSVSASVEDRLLFEISILASDLGQSWEEDERHTTTAFGRLQSLLRLESCAQRVVELSLTSIDRGKMGCVSCDRHPLGELEDINRNVFSSSQEATKRGKRETRRDAEEDVGWRFGSIVVSSAYIGKS